ncbi:hypothetical protein [Nocardioides terrisoli]|uniref:hypothetical protein n=1 Tax=Nocardioides terrisoli TaxID=3388267 RepID=UPI00287BC86D|nr:hypothetical protein [Nocardioides marmorisolisilvae]
MIPRPTTEKLILECCHNLEQLVAPEVGASAAQQALAVIATTLRTAAVRSAHEVAWMLEETDLMAAYARAGLDALSGTPEVADIVAPEPAASYHLDDVVSAYEAGSIVLARLLELAADAGEDELRAQGRAILARRIDRENEINGAYVLVGRDD